VIILPGGPRWPSGGDASDPAASAVAWAAANGTCRGGAAAMKQRKGRGQADTGRPSADAGADGGEVHAGGAGPRRADERKRVAANAATGAATDPAPRRSAAQGAAVVAPRMHLKQFHRVGGGQGRAFCPRDWSRRGRRALAAAISSISGDGWHSAGPGVGIRYSVKV
jgi:hypothetical protein